MTAFEIWRDSYRRAAAAKRSRLDSRRAGLALFHVLLGAVRVANDVDPTAA